jgi:hypothetical protein
VPPEPAGVHASAERMRVTKSSISKGFVT